MSADSMAERTLALMVERAQTQTAFSQELADHGGMADLIAQSRMEIDEVRQHGHRPARREGRPRRDRRHEGRRPSRGHASDRPRDRGPRSSGAGRRHADP